MVFKNICVLVLWTKVASALEGLRDVWPSVASQPKWVKTSRERVRYCLSKYRPPHCVSHAQENQSSPECFVIVNQAFNRLDVEGQVVGTENA